MKKPGILDLFLHLLFLQPTFHLGLMLLFCFLKLGYTDIFLEAGGGGSWLYVVLVSEATRSSSALGRFSVHKSKTKQAWPV